jgi:hypothetical protein
MAALQDSVYGVAVRHDADLRLLCRIRRSANGDVYFLIPRDEPGWNPHASYHRDGTRHVRSHGGRYLISQIQRPDHSFRGTENLFAMAIQPGEVALLQTQCMAEEFSEVFEIDHPQIPPEEHHTLAADLVEPGYSAIPVLGTEAIVQRTFRDASPWILVTLWGGMR